MALAQVAIMVLLATRNSLTMRYDRSQLRYPSDLTEIGFFSYPVPAAI
jgi:hypothetical protein